MTVTWYQDPAGQNQVDQQSWYYFPGTGLNPTRVMFNGPAMGPYLIIGFEDTDSQTNQSVITQFKLFGMSVLRTRHEGRGYGVYNVNNQTPPVFYDPQSNYLAINSSSVTTGNTLTRLMPLYAGAVSISWATGSGTTDMHVIINDVGHENGGNGSLGAPPVTQIWQQHSNAQGEGNAIIALPRSQCQFQLVNGNASSQTLFFAAMIIEEPG
jgi:hypothetical protein